jgi:hypothetical protein
MTFIRVCVDCILSITFSFADGNRGYKDTDLPLKQLTAWSGRKDIACLLETDKYFES